MTEIERLRPVCPSCDFLNLPSGLNSDNPVFRWALEGSAEGQQAARILIAATDADVRAKTPSVWDSGQRNTGRTEIIYDGPPMSRDKLYWWTVQLWDEVGNVSELARPASFFTGLRSNGFDADWIARYFVLPAGREVPQTGSYDNRFQARPADYVRKEVAVRERLLRATAYVTALGLYEFHVNGVRVGQDIMAPGWTDYHTRVEYQTHDITDLLKQGQNCIGAILGEGWYSGRVGHNQRRAGNHYGGRPAFLCQLHLEYADGQIDKILSDDSWQTRQGPILYSDFLAGEAYDARREIDGWCDIGHDTTHWQPVEAFIPEHGRPQLDAARVQPVRETVRFPAKYLHDCEAEHIFDLSRNIAGYMEMACDAPAGTVFRLRHAERLDDQGKLYTDNLRYAVSEDIYIAAGQGREVFKPRFTFHGFQYVGLTIEAPDGAAVTLPELTGIAIHSDCPITGQIETGHAALNQLISNIEWSQRDNFLSVPTDCPQRDERYGWSADAQVFWKTAGYMMDVSAFFAKWMQDLADGQTNDGAFPDVAPTKPLNPYRLTPQPGAPGWGDGPIIMAWYHHLRYDDAGLLRTFWPNFVAWMDYIEAANPEGIRCNRVNNNYGDWLHVGPPTDRALVATAYWIHLADLMRSIAGVIGEAVDRWEQLAFELRAAFRREYVSSDGRLKSDTQTAYLLALDFDLLPDQGRLVARQRLEELFADADWHLQTGFLGVRHVCPVIADHVSPERAVDLLLKDSYPSWLFSVRHGATSIWERWDGWTPEQGFQSAAMNSFNHYAYGAVGEWIWSRLAGIDWNTSKAGYRLLSMRPVFDTRIGYVTAKYSSRSGDIVSCWKLEDGKGSWTVELPPNVSANVELQQNIRNIMVDGEKSSNRFQMKAGVHQVIFQL
ncbi:alpha-L-rhamnosidase [Qingshengfaniella alkalisoli]|nr:alpha-L-rhamnosidase [Qingshengfaniella alkalisoli]